MGKPSWFNTQLLLSEYIGHERHTKGTETSKYLEEEKTIVIPSVAASERGTAQTRELALWGCGTSHMELQRSRLNEEVWKGPPKKVKAL
jgi:hypothetical protein